MAYALKVRIPVLELGTLILNPPPATTTFNVTVPNDADIVPPGYYMVAITASNGSTSTAKWVKIEYAL